MPISALIRDINGKYNIQEVNGLPEINADDWFAMVVAVLAGPDAKGVKTILEQLIEIGSDLEKGKVACKLYPVKPDYYYTYAYFKSANQMERRWHDAFYVGKGREKRWLAHVGEVFDRLKNDLPMRNDKEKLIADWLVENHHNEGTRKRAQEAAIGELVQRIYETTNNDALAEATAFFTEYFLITRALDAQDLANDTAGNRKSKNFIGLVQPKAFNHNNPVHKLLWNNAIIPFIANPEAKCIDITHRPGLRFIGADSLIETMNEAMESVGLLPYDMRNKPENRLQPESMTHNHVSVSGAADSILSYYYPNNQVFRFDFRLQPGGVETNISLRPLSSKAHDKQAFINFMENLTLAPVQVGQLRSLELNLLNYYGALNTVFIKNRNNWPFCKPITLGADGDTACWHNIMEPHARRSCMVDWIQGPQQNNQVELSLLEAVELTARAFRLIPVHN